MNAVVIEHVALNELPAAWRAQLFIAPSTRFTVRIEEETASSLANTPPTNPLFGMWRDSQEKADVSAYARQLRNPRYALDNSKADES